MWMVWIVAYVGIYWIVDIVGYVDMWDIWLIVWIINEIIFI